jgi:hypothetical protein
LSLWSHAEQQNRCGRGEIVVTDEAPNLSLLFQFAGFLSPTVLADPGRRAKDQQIDY